MFQVANNHFAHFFAPQNLTNLKKNVVFVIDISTSMEGQKLKQVNGGLKQFPQQQLFQPRHSAYAGAVCRQSLGWGFLLLFRGGVI